MFNRLFGQSPIANLLFFFLLLTGCTFEPESLLLEAGLITPTPTPDPFYYYRAALQPGMRSDIEAAGPLPRYHITATLDEAGTTLNGLVQVIVPTPGAELVFRLYPNLSNYGGASHVSTARINNISVEVEPLAEGQAMRLILPSLINRVPSSPITVALAFTTRLAGQRGIDSANYALFGWDGPVLSLPGFYPTLAVKQDEAWVLDTPPAHADVLFNEAALYQLDLTLPRDLVVVASGVTLSVIDNSDGNRTWQIAGGPLRDMTVLAGPFQAVSEMAAGATVTAYYLSGHQTAAEAALAHAAASLRLYSDLYGPYPYTELDLVEAPLNVRGMEYSGLILMGEDLYQNPQEFLTFLAAHEVAHQWWYAVVGSNPYQHPWLDEGLAEYSAYEYYRHIFGQAEAERLLTGRWLIPFDLAASGGLDGAVDRPAAAFDPASYELLVYAKAALFFNALREQVGEASYRQVLQTYYAENRYRIVTPVQFLATAQQGSGENLKPLAEEWLGW